MSSANTIRPQKRTLQFTEWLIPTGGPAPLTNIATVIEQATGDPDRGEQPLWYRLDNTPNGPVIVVGYSSEAVEGTA